jgi:hypothetical protein
MKKQAVMAIEVEALAPSTLSAPDELREPVSLDGGDYPSKPETPRRAAVRWFIDTLALAGAGMAGVYVGVWLDPRNVSGDGPAERQAGLDSLNDSFAERGDVGKERVPAEIGRGPRGVS